jgi:hypothetical protein
MSSARQMDALTNNAHSLTVIDAPDTIPATARVALSNYLRAHPGANVAGSRIILRNDFATYGRVNGAVEVRIDWAREQAFRMALFVRASIWRAELIDYDKIPCNFHG